ncbi:hypothetical protein CDL12_26213 [Handroanthus impetiginosus]|uniref:Uncharacterized protein n=1 Tax=Handroanthus impetiginosus TaxID=429701 RepID=A0A2G9G7K8_9LAMI|nr:hypothetical protein CDL12_26213 [Handroanthus impetiginosus]
MVSCAAATTSMSLLASTVWYNTRVIVAPSQPFDSTGKQEDMENLFKLLWKIQSSIDTGIEMGTHFFLFLFLSFFFFCFFI